MATIRKKRRRKTVRRRAKPLTTGLMLLEISQRTSSARTAASAMVIEKVRAERRLMLGREPAIAGPSLLPNPRSLRPLSLEKTGNSFCWTRADTARKVSRNGNDEKTTDAGLSVRPSGRHSSQCDPKGNMEPDKNQRKAFEAYYCFHQCSLFSCLLSGATVCA